MSQKTIGITFSNVNSGSPELYVSTVAGSEWVSILLPQGSTYTDSVIDLPAASQQQVYFLFAAVAPADVQGFINLYRPYLARFRSNSATNLTTAWINCPGDITTTNQPINPGPGDPANTVVINFIKNINGDFVVGQPFNTTMGNGFATLTIINNTPVLFTPPEAPDTLQLSYTPGNPNMSFANKTLGTNSLFSSSISIPFSGSGSSGFRFSLGLNLVQDFAGYGLQNNYYFGDSNAPDVLSYPILKSGANSDQYAMTQVQLNVLDTSNANGLNTYFALSGKIYNRSTSTYTPAFFLSNFSINTGYPLIFWPAINLLDSGASINSLFPEEFSARFVLSPQDAFCTQKFYMVPEGDFYLDPGNQSAFKNEDGQCYLLPGLSGTEVISFTPYTNGANGPEGSVLRFKSRYAAYAPNYPGQPVSLASPGDNKPTLSPSYLTAWANVIINKSGIVKYASQPQGASLYAKNHGVASPEGPVTGFLGFFEPAVDMPQTTDFYTPMVGYLGINTIYPPGTKDTSPFESKVLSAERKARITATKPVASVNRNKTKRQLFNAADAENYTVSATPQGLIANVMDAGNWSLLNLAQNTVNSSGGPQYLNPVDQQPADPSQYQLSFINLSTELQNAFLTNQQFLVMTNKEYLGQPYSKMANPVGGSTTADPVFNNKMSIEDWPFDLNVGTNNTYADYNNVLIFKFCQGKLIDRVKNPKDWTQADKFSLDSSNGLVNTPDEGYNQLVAVSAWLQNYLQVAEDAYDRAVAAKNLEQARFYQKFHDIINSSTWNGILALKVDINLQSFPQQLKGMICGITLKNFNAHHVGIEVNRVNDSGVITMEKQSSLFGLINYIDPAYGAQIAQGVDPDAPILPTPGLTYDFKVLSLQVLFENTAIKDFSSKVQLTMNNLFSDKVIRTNNKYGFKELNTIVLNGVYQDHNGTAVYVFDNKDDNLFYFDSNLLKNVEIAQIQFNTLTTDPDAIAIQSSFTMSGFLNFGIMSGTAGDGYTLDAFSFGDKATMQHGLYYSNLHMNMGFSLNNPTVVVYAFDASQIAFNSSQSAARAASLYPNFALQINNLVSGDDDSTPAGMGYLTLSLPGINASGLSGNWYGLQLTLNLGTPGELAGSLGFNATLLIAWSPGTNSVTPSYNVLIGIKLPGTSSNAKLLSLQGLLKLTIDQLRLQYVMNANPDLPGSYLLTLTNIALKFLGIIKLPPGGNTNFLLFGNPNPGAVSKSLGWYAAYNKTVKSAS